MVQPAGRQTRLAISISGNNLTMGDASVDDGASANAGVFADAVCDSGTNRVKCAATSQGAVQQQRTAATEKRAAHDHRRCK